jgi:glycosyltransferase involved in cell wall biosynthesis
LFFKGFRSFNMGCSMPTSAETLDCEFSLALNNRTGKYFFCKDMIDASRDLIRTCYYWRVPLTHTPPNSIARVLGRLARIEVNVRARQPFSNRIFRPIAHHRAMVFTDPRECLLYRLKPCDVVLCHDMGPLTHPEFYSPGVKEIYTLAFDRIKAVKPLMLFVSAASRDDFVKLYGNDFPLLQVIHIPLRKGMDRRDEQVVNGLPAKFLLTVGSLGARKNQVRSIMAFEASGLANEGFAYIICGGPEPDADRVIALARQTAGVILPGYVNDDELRWLYKNASGFVLPSLLEGFGLPATEAINYGLVPLLAAGGALQEVAGDMALYVNPLDVTDIAAAMRRLATMTEAERNRRLTQLRLSIERFSLENAIATWRSALELAVASSRSL